MANIDPTRLRSVSDYRRHLRTQIRDLEERYGGASNHPELVALRQQLAAVDAGGPVGSLPTVQGPTTTDTADPAAIEGSLRRSHSVHEQDNPAMANVEGLLQAPNSRDNLETYFGATAAQYQADSTMSATAAPTGGNLAQPATVHANDPQVQARIASNQPLPPPPTVRPNPEARPFEPASRGGAIPIIDPTTGQPIQPASGPSGARGRGRGS